MTIYAEITAHQPIFQIKPPFNSSCPPREETEQIICRKFWVRMGNPNGIESFSPALIPPGGSYAGDGGENGINPEGVESNRVRTGCNPFRVGEGMAGRPRVARAAQPWAE